MALVKASAGKSYKADSTPLVRLMSTGIRISKKTASDMGLAVGDKIQYAQDDETNELYLFKGNEEDGGNVLGKNFAFSNTGLDSKMKSIANVPHLEIKGGTSIHFAVATEGMEVEGTSYFALTLLKVEKADSEDSEDVEEVEEDVFG